MLLTVLDGADLLRMDVCAQHQPVPVTVYCANRSVGRSLPHCDYAFIQVVIEVDGPPHFSVNSHRPLGRTVGRRYPASARPHLPLSLQNTSTQALQSPHIFTCNADFSASAVCHLYVYARHYSNSVPHVFQGTSRLALCNNFRQVCIAL